MRHGKKINHLSRTASHRSALLSNMASSLILNKRITTTVAKAKALKKYVEPLITKAKTDSTHSRRTVMSYLQNKESVQTLFGEVAGRTSDRPGGYTRIIKMGDVRLGDNAEMCLLELVDFNDLYKKDGAEKKAKTRRSRKGKKAEGAEAEVETAVAEVKEEKPKKTAKKSSKKAE
jgi:large subunit ribosomal protein L17